MVSWSDGRKLTSGTKGTTSFSYTYNADGLRTGKSSGSTVYTYSRNENRQLQSMTWNTGYAVFSYDVNGMPYSVRNYDAILNVERTYLYITNLQGDVLSIIDQTTGQTAVSYTYDAWGKLISKTGYSSDFASIYEFNPLTYRGYIYDGETGFYYLQSRYYDPSVGRFLNADDVQYLGASSFHSSWNQFSYCENNVPNAYDPSGTDVIILHDSGGACGAGHTGLLIEYKGRWYYWYWGPKFKTMIYEYAINAIFSWSMFAPFYATIPMGTTAYRILNIAAILTTFVCTLLSNVTAEPKLYYLNKNVKNELSNPHKFLSYINGVCYNGKKVDGFEYLMYIRGNFEKGYSYLDSLRKKSVKYNLILLNCMQTSLEAIIRGKLSNGSSGAYQYLTRAKSLVIPNMAYGYLLLFFNSTWRYYDEAFD